MKLVNKIIALDPGIARTGFAIMTKVDNQITPLEYGCLTTDAKETLEKRLKKLYQELMTIIIKYSPKTMILEKVFFNNNQKTAITVGQAQGVMILAAAMNNLKIEFVTPLQIKSSLTGYGLADKQQVQKMVKTLLNLDQIPKPDDTADALACGLTYLSLHQFADVI